MAVRTDVPAFLPTAAGFRLRKQSGARRAAVCSPRPTGFPVSGRAVRGRLGRAQPLVSGYGRPSSSKKLPKKEKLEAEEVFYDGPPSWTELIIPAVSVLTVIGILPFTSAVLRRFWVRYRITSRRIRVQSGYRGRREAEVVYRDIKEVRYVRRFGGSAADFVLFLRDGAKLELRAVPNFRTTYDYIMARVDHQAPDASPPGEPQGFQKT
ncbi:hypothetical protein CDCA_CDCA04G1273 [Cyanidium caldarium]|uniref:YdbS-like PH domain-containing protein n=1 Tax=Cyanidium caldarium TaxID=2771 RepID=A0AAV9ITR5_CYACA|nr:hypothetical protein CDCA_CDCA04G1273 [Cyanidium caldarium]